MQMRALVAVGAAAVLACAGAAQAAPAGGTIVGGGTATISSASNGPGTTVTVDQTSDKLYVDWTSFDIDASDIVNFNQNTIQSIAVNRVTGGGAASAINGALNANGHVWILNPAGIAFGAMATVNVGGLLVTTADLDPTTFMSTAVDDAGGFTFTSGGNSTATVSNAGTINSSGLLALVAPFVDNSGSLTSSYGDVLLGGAEAFRVSFSEVARADPTPFDELLVTDFIIDTPMTNDPTPGAETVPVTNTGSISGANVIATAASVGGGAFINMDGVVEATSVGTQSGDIVLLGGGDFTGGAADASSGATDAVRIKNADLTAADDLVIQGTGVSIEKGTGPGTITSGTVRIEATAGNVTSDTALETTSGAVDITASGLASLSGVDAKTTLDVTADDIDLADKLAATGAITLDATGVDISGTDVDIEGGSVELTGPVVATDSATIKAATGDVTLNDDLTSSGMTTGSVLIEAKSGKATTAGLDAAATTASGATIDVTADDVELNGVVRADGAVTLTAETGDLLTHDTVTGASVDMEATLGDVVADDTITSTLGAVGIDAVVGLADLHAVDSKMTLDVTADDIDLAGKLAAVGAITLDATGATKDISGTNIDIEGGSVDLTGPVVATTGATVKATSGDATLNDDITSTGSILIEAASGTASVKGVDADTTTKITAKDIDLDGLVNGDISTTLDATDVNISGTNIGIEGGSVELTGPVVATDSATIKAATGDVTLNDDLTSSGTTTGSILIEAKSGKVTTAGLDATATTASGATIDVTADDVELNGVTRADGAVTLTAETGDLLTHDTVTGASVDMEATLGDVVADDTITSTLGAVGIDAVAGLADLHAVDSKTTLDVTADDIDLAGKLAAVGAITLDATGADISGTNIDIEGGSVELTGPALATTGATIKATSGDATLNDDITSTGSILIEAASGTASVKGVDADTTTKITAKDIDLDGLVNGDTSTTLNASNDISGTDIDITGGSVTLSGKVVATNSATIQATNTNVTLNGDLVSSGSALVEALLGKVTAAGLSAITTLEVYAREIMISGDAVAGGDVTIRASNGDATLSGSTESTGGNLLVEANLGTVSIFDAASHLATTITGGTVEVLGDIVSDGQVTLQALTGNVDIAGSVTANGGLLLLNAAQGDAVINKIASTSNVSIQALDLDLSGSITAADEVVLTSLDSGTTIVLGGDGGIGSISLRKPQGLTIDAGELGRISAGNLRIDAASNDALLRSVNFSGATLDDFSIGANTSSWIMTDGTVTGLTTLTLGYIDGLKDRRPELVLINGSLGVDSASGADWLGNVVVNSSQDIIIGSQTFRTYYETLNPSLSQLGSLPSTAVGVESGHVFIATSNLELYAPGDIIQLNTGSGVDGKGLVFKVSAVGKAVLNPSDLGPEKVVLFGIVVRDDGTRVTSFSAGLEPRLLYEGETDANGNVIEEPLAQSDDYHFNLCIIGDAVSCSNALLRQAEGTSAAAGTDPNPNVLQSGLTFNTGDDQDDDDDDTSGVAATGNESLWGASAQ